MEVMEILWRLKSASIRELQEKIVERKRPAYTTIQTIVQRLEHKGAVTRARKIGNAYIVEPRISRATAFRAVIDELLHRLGGSRPLVAYLFETGQLTLEDLKALEKGKEGGP